MDYLHQFISYFLSIDTHLQVIIQNYGEWVYGLLFAIIFCETGLVITPFLPGDSLLFAAGTMAAITELNVHWLALSLCFAAILGDSVNYAIGKYVGPKVFYKEKSLLLNKKYLMHAHNFYQKYGNKTIVIARFIPIIRTFAPFIAGIASMRYRQFIIYNIVGAILWVYSFIYVSYLFGNIPVVKENFSLIIVGIIILSLLPPLLEFIRAKRTRTQ